MAKIIHNKYTLEATTQRKQFKTCNIIYTSCPVSKFVSNLPRPPKFRQRLKLFFKQQRFWVRFKVEISSQLSAPQQGMKQQSAWLLNHISTRPIKQWSARLGPKSRHKAHSRAIESIWLHPHLTSHSSWPRIHGNSRKAPRGIRQFITFLSLHWRPGLRADIRKRSTLTEFSHS